MKQQTQLKRGKIIGERRIIIPRKLILVEGVIDTVSAYAPQVFFA